MNRSTKLICLALFSISILTIPVVYATNPLVIKANDVKFHPAPGFPKGAQIVILRGDLTKPEPYTIRFKLPAGYTILSHWHDKDEETTVISGSVNVGTGDNVDKSASTSLAAGGFAIIPAMTHHYVWTTEETVFQLDGMGPRKTIFVNPQEWNQMILKSNQ